MEIFEESHKNTIEDLVREFGEERRDEIIRIYNERKKEIEDSANVRDYVSVLAYKSVREYFNGKN